MNYILTENHFQHGLKGMVINREQYLATPYNDRALYEWVGDETDYSYKLVIERLQEITPKIYLMRHALALKEIIDELDLDKYFGEILANLKPNGTMSIFLPNVKYTFYTL